MAWRTATTTTSYLALATRPRSYLVLGTLIFAILTLLLLFRFEPITSRIFNWTESSSFALSTVSAQVCNGTDTDTDGSEHINKIPNIVHYVWILRDPAVFSLDFKLFISFYSAHLYFQPDAIYIHTDASPDVFEHANKSGDVWTQRILALPNIRYHQVSPLIETRKGVPITRLEHKADFLRMEALYEFGGVYMDSDAVPLRDVADLRNSGFANIVGGAVALTMKHTGKINNGVMMSVPRGTMMDIYIQAAHQFFDGSWAKASVLLLTDLANRLSAVPYEVLVLQPTAFAPTSWEFADQKRLFKPYAQTPVTNDSLPRPLGQPKTCQDIFNWLEEMEKDKTESWEMDFSSTYILHAFDDDIPKIRGWDHKRDLRYILSRQSNYARAVYPAIAHAITAGVIPREEG
jgi:Glycosyltransferase sugar-binding region containing DXD motif